MTVYYQQIRALIDPEQSDPLPGGGRLQDVSLILLDGPGRHGEPVGIALLACHARDLAVELMALAEDADRESTRP